LAKWALLWLSKLQVQNAEIEGSQAPWMMDFLMFWDVQAAPETIKKWGKKILENERLEPSRDPLGAQMH